MTRGTPSIGKRHQRTHTFCVRCGLQTYHKQKKTCASCGFPAARTRKYPGWSLKIQRRKGKGTGRMRYEGTIPRRAKNGFRSGTVAKAAVKK